MSQLPSIRYARERGYRVVAVDGAANAVAFPYCDVAENVDFSDIDRVADLGARHRVAGVLAISSDRAVVPAAGVAAALGLPGIGVDVAIAMTDKAAMRSRLAAEGVAQPRHRVLAAGVDVDAAFAEVGAPAVLKPADSGGQRGVFLVESANDVSRHLHQALELSRSGQAMLEEYIPGTELNGLFVVRAGESKLITLSDRLRPSGVGFGVGWAHSFPSALAEHAVRSAEAVAASAIRALGLQDGIAFPQLIVPDDHSARLIEIAARIPAGQMADLVRFGTGINLFDIAFAQALGRRVPDGLTEHRWTRPVAIRFLTADPGVLPVGKVTHAGGLLAARNAPGVLAAGLYFGAGDTIDPVRVDADRKGYVIATAQTASAALELADVASSRFEIRTEDASTKPLEVELAGSASRQARPVRRALRFLPVALALALLGATAIAFVVTERAKLQRALVAGTRITKQFSPTCDCNQHVAHIAFRVLRRARVTVEMVNAAGRPVEALLRDKLLSPGWQHLTWNGRTALGSVVRDGGYRPSLDFVALHRTLDLPSSVIVDTKPPRLLRLQARLLAHDRVVVRYTFGEPTQALLLVDGRRAVLTRSSQPTGTVDWSGVFSDGERLTSGIHHLSLTGIDLAGNRVKPQAALTWRAT